MAQQQPDPKFMAQQLRKPSGEAAAKVGDTMDSFNEPLFDLTLETMDLNDGDQVLEIGFGTGKFFPRLFSRSMGLKVHGIDYSNEMVETARSNNFQLINSGLLNVQTGESNRLPFENDTFDKVYTNMVVYFWDRPEEHLAEVKRVLKPGGKLFTGIRTRESMKQLPVVDFGFNLFSKDEWIASLENNHFTYLETKEYLDPPISTDEDEIQLQSLCIVAEVS